MTARMSAARKEAFLAALAETGNATLAAEQAGLSRSWAGKARLTDAGFDARVRAARAAAEARLGALDGNRPPEGWRVRAAVELVVTRGGGRRGAQVARAAGDRRWGKRTEERFLTALGQTRNLRFSAGAAGMSVASLEKHMRKWPAFTRRVRAVLRISAARLAMLLITPREDEVEAALEAAGLRAIGVEGAWVPEEMSMAEMLRTARRNKRTINGE